MQESENKAKHTGRHAAKHQAPASAEVDSFLDEYDLLGDEGDIPLRVSRKANKKPRKPEKKKKSRGKRRKKASSDDLLFSEKMFRTRRSLFEILSASNEDGFFKPLHIFGIEIRFWPLFILAFLIMMAGVLVINNGNVERVDETITVVGLPKDLENYKILVLSDMNGKRFGDEQSALLREVEGQKYDMILCVGDMVGKDGDPEPFYEFLDGLSYPSRVYFTCGDADPGPFVSEPREIRGTLEQIVLEDWILGAIERGAHYVDVPMSVKVGESAVWLTPTNYLNLNAISLRDDWREQMNQEEDGVVSGLVSDYNSLPFTSYRYAQAQKFYAAVNSIKSTDFMIGLSHIVPDDAFIESAAMHDGAEGYLFEPEMIVSGHNCGGVWKLPLVGALYVPNRMLPRYGWFPEKEDVEGCSRVGECQIYITSGLSTTASIPILPFRLLNKPTISYLVLTAKLPDNMLEEG